MRKDLREALAAALGDDHSVQHTHLQALQAKILPMWRTLPKNEAGGIDKPSLRFGVPRHFSSEHEEVALLTEFAPQFV